MENLNLFLTPREVQDLFKVSRQTIYEWRNRKDFPAPMALSPKTYRYSASEVMAWAKEKKRLVDLSDLD